MKNKDRCNSKTSRTLLTETLPAVLDDIDLAKVNTKDIELIMRKLMRILPLKDYEGHTAEELVFTDAKTRVGNMSLENLVIGSVYTLQEFWNEVEDIPGMMGHSTNTNSLHAIIRQLAAKGIVLDATGKKGTYYIKHICPQNTESPSCGDIPCELIIKNISKPVRVVLHFIAAHIYDKYGLDFGFHVSDIINFLDQHKILLTVKNVSKKTYGSVFAKDISAFIDDIFIDSGFSVLASNGIINVPQDSNYRYHYPLRLVVVEKDGSDDRGKDKFVYHRTGEMAKLVKALFGEQLERKRSYGSYLHSRDRMRVYTKNTIQPYKLAGCSQASGAKSMEGYFSNVEECYFERVVKLNPCIHYPKLNEDEQYEIAYRIHLAIISRLETKYESYSSGKSKKPVKNEFEAYPKLIQLYKTLVEGTYGYPVIPTKVKHQVTIASV